MKRKNLKLTITLTIILKRSANSKLINRFIKPAQFIKLNYMRKLNI